MKRAPVIAFIIALVAGLWIASGYYGIGKKPADANQVTAEVDQVASVTELEVPRVRVVSSTSIQRVREIKLFGRTEPERTVEVSAETSGKIVSMDLAEGSLVDKGDIVVHLSMAGRNARLDEAKAKVKYHEISYEAAEKLSEKQFTSEVKLAEVYAALEAARAAFSIAQLDIVRTKIKVPFAGVLEKLLLEVGDYVDIGAAVALIVDLDPVVVVVEVTEREISQVRVGQGVRVRLFSGQEREGTIGYISRSASIETRTFRVEINLDNPGYEIPEGMTADVTMMTSPVSAHHISPAILTLDDAGVLGVKTVNKDSLVKFYSVQIVADTPDGIWISGLPDQVQFITVGQEYVSEGQRVEALSAG